MNPFVEAVTVRQEAVTLSLVAQWHRAEAKYHQDTLDKFKADTKPGPIARVAAIQLRERAIAFHTACADALTLTLAADDTVLLDIQAAGLVDVTADGEGGWIADADGMPFARGRTPREALTAWRAANLEQLA